MLDTMSTKLTHQDASSPQPVPVLEMRGITKRFLSVTALNQMSLTCSAGEVHALVGENGAGKSTLMKILVGAYQPDEGEIYFKGQRVLFRSPREAQKSGLNIIYQEFNLLPERTIAQNIFLGREPTRYGLLDNSTMERETVALLKHLNVDHLLAPHMLVKHLSVAQQQIVEIAKALSYKSSVLVMDEPTAALTITEAEQLFNIVKQLQARGLAIIYISHRFEEVFALADRITVLKDGVKVATVGVKDVTSHQLVTLMVGRELEQYFPAYANVETIGEEVLSIENGRNTHVQGINLALRRGEIVGLAGLQGSGRTELAHAIFGLEPFTSGHMTIQGCAVHVRSPLQAIQHKIGFVTEDRKGEGLNLLQSVGDNILLAVRALRNVFIRRAENYMASQLMQDVDVRAANIHQDVQYLSGGNQQKVVLSKWLATGAEILILDEPTRGIDINAKATIYELIRQLTQAGKAVLLISSELPEIIGMSDRILVMRKGTIVGELPRGSSERDIMLRATGEHE